MCAGAPSEEWRVRAENKTKRKTEKRCEEEGWGSCVPRIFILISRPKVALSIFNQGKHVLARIGSTANANVEAFLVPSYLHRTNDISVVDVISDASRIKQNTTVNAYTPR